jgi:pilus assembly protein Flp/PilA
MFLQMLVNELQKREEGQGLIEYALIVLLIAIVVIVVLTAVGGQINGVFQNIFNTLQGANT